MTSPSSGAFLVWRVKNRKKELIDAFMNRAKERFKCFGKKPILRKSVPRREKRAKGPSKRAKTVFLRLIASEGRWFLPQPPDAE